MSYGVRINIFFKDGVFDPAASTTKDALNRLEIGNFSDLRIGKLIELQVAASSPEEATSAATNACKKLLANEVMEKFSIESVTELQ